MQLKLEPHHIHIWSTELAIDPVQEKHFLSLLSADETLRVNRIRLPRFRQRAIAARGFLRTILSHYLHVAPTAIVLGSAEHNKPYLIAPNPLDIQFNLAHSNDLVLYAITMHYPIGVDIEKIAPEFNLAIARRYFSVQEYTALAQLPINEQNQAFYRLWSRKEAIVKAIGVGLTMPLSSFSVASTDINETIQLESKQWSLQPLPLFTDYTSAVASAQPIKHISYWRPTADGYTMITR